MPPAEEIYELSITAVRPRFSANFLSGWSILMEPFFSLFRPSRADATVTDGLTPPVFGGG